MGHPRWLGGGRESSEDCQVARHMRALAEPVLGVAPPPDSPERVAGLPNAHVWTERPQLTWTRGRTCPEQCNRAVNRPDTAAAGDQTPVG